MVPHAAQAHRYLEVQGIELDTALIRLTMLVHKFVVRSKPVVLCGVATVRRSGFIALDVQHRVSVQHFLGETTLLPLP